MTAMLKANWGKLLIAFAIGAFFGGGIIAAVMGLWTKLYGAVTGAVASVDTSLGVSTATA